MKNTLQEYLHRFQKEHKRGCRYASVVGVLALITILVVNWQLHGTGVALSGDAEYVCGKEEHEHSLKEGCYEVNDADLICGFTEGQIVDLEAAAAADAAAGKSTATSEETAKADSSQAHTSAEQNNSTAAQSTTDQNSQNNTASDQSSNTSGDSSQSSADNAAHNAKINQQIAELEAQEIPTEKEHHHSDACYEEKQVETEPAKTEKELTCGKSEHTHDDSCYSVQESAAEGEEGSENSEAASAEKTLTCGQEEHSHTDSCYTEKTTDAQTTTEKTLICGLEEGQKVAMTEEEIQRAKDEKAKKIEELKAQLVEETTAQTSENNSSATASESNNAAENSASANVENNASANTTVDNDSSAAANTSASAEGNTTASDQTTGTTDSTNTGTTENAGTGSNTAATTDTTANTDANANAAGTTGTNTADSTNAFATGTTVTDSTNAAASGTTGTDSTNASTSGTTAKTENASADTTNDGRHHHTIDCYSTYKLICQKEEHKHTSACLIDKNADVETAADWEATIPSLTGDKAADLISVGRSQLGYTESTRNYDEESHRGYTRYGAWYGNPYGDWGTMFTAFCLRYANISGVPTNSGVQAWISSVQSEDMWWDADEYASGVKAGDLIFFNDSNDHMGIVSSISDTSVTVIEGNRPNGDGPDSVQENTYSTTDGSIAGYCELPTGDNHDNEIKVMDSAYGVDISNLLTAVKLWKNENNEWKESTEFTTTDQVKGSFNFSNLEVQKLKDNQNKCYIPLSDNIDCSVFADSTYDLLDDCTQAGTYKYVKDENTGKWNIVLEFNQNYINNAGSYVHGSVDFEFKWNIKNIPEEGKTENVQIGQWTGTITIKDNETKGAAFNISKQASQVYLDEQGYAYIDYTVKLTVNGEDGYQGPINVSEVLTGKGFEFVGDSVAISKSDGGAADATIKTTSLKTTDTGAEAEFQITSKASDGMVAAGEYKITYKVKTTQVFGKDATIDKQVNNKATVTDKGKEYPARTWTQVTTGGIDKSGHVTTEDGHVYITYTVTINKGSVIANLTEDTKFSDIIPEKLKLVEDSVKITQYEASGKATGTIIDHKYDETTQKLTSTLPKGQFYYVIEYKTEVKDVSSLPLEGEKIINTAHSEGGVEGEDSDTQTVGRDDALTKTFESQSFGKTESGSDTVIMKWKSVINADIKANDTYVDWGNIYWKDNKAIGLMSMTESQRNNIKLYGKDGNQISDGYKIESYSKQENDQEVGLFQITFTKDISGPVTIEYETTGDLSSFSIGDSINYVNYCKFNTLQKQASTTVKYLFEDHSIIWKHKGDYEWNHVNTGNVTLNPGENTLTWYITVNNENKDSLKNIDLVITDKIADGMSFVEGSLYVERGSWENITSNVTCSCDNGVLTIKIDKKINTGKIEIRYKTKLPDSFFQGSDVTKDFTNTATIEYNGSTSSSSYTQKVTRKVAQKTGTYDKTKRLLTYQIALNPNGNTLNNGNTMTVTDTLSGSLASSTRLNSLALYTAKEETDADGKVSYTAQALIKEMTADTATPTQEYHYYYNNGTFTALIPDGVACVMVAQYTVKEFAADTVMYNDVTLTGQSSWKADQYEKTLEKNTSGTVTTDHDSLTVLKRDTDNYYTTLSEAKFELKALVRYNADTEQWVDFTSSGDAAQNTAAVQELVTGADGKSNSAPIQRNVIYKLTETAQPDGYILDSTPYYFIALANGESFTLPDSISGESAYSKDGVVLRYLTPIVQKTDSEAKVTYTGYDSITIERYNKREKTTVEKGQLRVSKTWKDSNGNPLTNVTDLDKMSAITVTLTKRTPEMATIQVSGENGGTCNIEVPFSQNTTVKLAGKFTSCDGATATIDNDKTVITGITKKNVVVKVQGNVGTDYAQTGVWKEIQNAASLERTVATTVSSVTLSKDNEWSYLWENLEKEDYITYTLTETAVDGYTATYQLNGDELNEGTEFSLGANGDVINITNTPNSKLYVLPKTGGSGVMPIYVTGGLLTAGAAGLWVTGKRRKREQ